MLIAEVWGSLATTHGLMLHPVTPSDDPAADIAMAGPCLLYTSDAADDSIRV